MARTEVKQEEVGREREREREGGEGGEGGEGRERDRHLASYG